MKGFKNIKAIFLLGTLIISSFMIVQAVDHKQEDKSKKMYSEDIEEEKPLPKLKTVDQCKADCTIDWQDCVTICGNNGPQQCYVSCQKKVKQCLDECPNVICHDYCSIELEKCQRTSKNLDNCESEYNDCQESCDNAYIGRSDL